MLLTAVCFILLVSCLGTTHSYDCGRSLYTDMRQCFLSEGIDFPELPAIQTRFSDLTTMCRQIGVYKNAVGCAMGYARKCLWVAEITRVRKGMDFLCQHSKHFDYQCMTNNIMNFQHCFKATASVLKQRYPEANRGSLFFTCTAADLFYECSELHLRNCPTLTEAIFLELWDEYIVPSVCEDKPPGRPRKSYVEGGAASLTHFFNPFRGTVVSMATLIFLRWSG